MNLRKIFTLVLCVFLGFFLNYSASRFSTARRISANKEANIKRALDSDAIHKTDYDVETIRAYASKVLALNDKAFESEFENIVANIEAKGRFGVEPKISTIVWRPSRLDFRLEFLISEWMNRDIESLISFLENFRDSDNYDETRELCINHLLRCWILNEPTKAWRWASSSINKSIPDLDLNVIMAGRIATMLDALANAGKIGTAYGLLNESPAVMRVQMAMPLYYVWGKQNRDEAIKSIKTLATSERRNALLGLSRALAAQNFSYSIVLLKMFSTPMEQEAIAVSTVEEFVRGGRGGDARRWLEGVINDSSNSAGEFDLAIITYFLAMRAHGIAINWDSLREDQLFSKIKDAERSRHLAELYLK